MCVHEDKIVVLNNECRILKISFNVTECRPGNVDLFIKRQKPLNASYLIFSARHWFNKVWNIFYNVFNTLRNFDCECDFWTVKFKCIICWYFFPFSRVIRPVNELKIVNYNNFTLLAMIALSTAQSSTQTCIHIYLFIDTSNNVRSFFANRDAIFLDY